MKIEEQASLYKIEKTIQKNSYAELPAENLLDIQTLSSVFNNMTNSYKPLFFLALLNKIKQQPDNDYFTFTELAAEMTVLAWYPLNFFNLSFGKQDQVDKIIDRLDISKLRHNITHPSFPIELNRLIQAQAESIKLTDLLNYVPYRLLTPFFRTQLKGIQDSKKNKIIQNLANECFSKNTTLYHFVEYNHQQAIQINTQWEHYFRRHFKIIYRWVMWEWSCYLQSRNPNTLAILQKILPPTQRQSLRPHHDLWKDAIQAGMDVYCIYTGENLKNKSFALDHFLPWSFVCHDQLWNLTPVTPTVNSKKSNHLPMKESIELLAEQQYILLTLTSKLYSSKKWSRLMSAHMNDLHLDEYELLSKTKLHHAYQKTLRPLLNLAKQAGFENMGGF